MDKEMKALERNETWKIVKRPMDKKPTYCKWIYTVKHKSDGTLIDTGKTSSKGIHLDLWHQL